ncbi:urea amidolyase family protein [Frigidibacter sp.]|uniref:5-oxoprolinase subunit B/C family protein n=1 Tax=Frigidibacter sp. TaxID=2586418 RepID=UPI00273763AA|nr:urea amidolyase family protein [Frigidibacter sp.]MDP3340969.1 urea amidolyase family protein [Frigidibacter sp.]
MRLLPAGDCALLVELSGLPEVLALLDHLRQSPLPGTVELIPGARTLLLRWQAGQAKRADLVAALQAVKLDPSQPPPPSGTEIEIPVRYDGADLAEVAALTGLSQTEVIRRHIATPQVVAFTGFAPGFAYLTGGDPALQVPRRQVPRPRIPAGAVALAGPFSGIYPRASPGGWQLLGTTPLAMWDLGREPPALLQPGDRVRFREMGPDEPWPVAKPARPARDLSPALRVLTAPLPLLFQDAGRPGLAGQGVSASGAADRGALAAANRAVGNPAGAPCLEITLGGVELLAEAPATLALAGAPAALRLTPANGEPTSPGFGIRFTVQPGDRLWISPPRAGLRNYLAAKGGFAVTPVLGSAATDTLSGIGPAPVLKGVGIAIGSLTGESPPPAQPGFAPPAPGDTVTLDILPGPRSDWFTPEALALLTAQCWEVTPQSSRVGIRLAGAEPLTRRDTHELPSEGMMPGALQVPHGGQPVLFLADHPLTGGYPVIAVLADHHLDLAGQLPPGARLRFRLLEPFAA